MEKKLMANQIRGRAIGATFFAVFGSIWILLALYVKQMLHVTTGLWLALDLTVLLAMAWWLSQQARRFPMAPEDPAQSRTFVRINVLQWVAVAAVCALFGRLRWDAYTLCAVTAIVGLHLFPLARLFRYPAHYVTGSLLVAWAAVSAAVTPAEHLQGTSAMGTGILLMLSSFATLILAATAVRRSAPSLAGESSAARIQP